MKVFLCFALLVAGAFAEVKNIELTPGGEEVTLQSDNYPEDSPANADKTWVLTTSEGNVIKVDCTDIRLFEEKPCGPWVLKITDGGNTEELCTSIFDFTKTSSGNKLELNFKTGNEDRGFLACTAKAVAK